MMKYHEKPLLLFFFPHLAWDFPASSPPQKMKSAFVRQGLPLMIFVVCGSLGLSQFVSGTVAAKDARVSTKSERVAHLEQTHKVLMNRLAKDMETVELKPIHRPPSV